MLEGSPRRPQKGPPQKGRSAAGDPPNRFLAVHRAADPDAELDPEDDPSQQRVATQFLPDRSESIVTENDSPDVPFRYSVNPYRGCEHGCSYCYARPSHEYLGLGAGLDFESKIFVKERAPELFARWLARDGWQPEMICFSGITDCYQPAERNYALTRGCLQVAAEARQPIGIITKNRLVTRDLDVLRPMAERSLVHVSISITTLDEQLARRMEPRTSRPAARLEAIRELSKAGVPTRVMVAPVIPGLNDSEIPQILKAAKWRRRRRGGPRAPAAFRFGATGLSRMAGAERADPRCPRRRGHFAKRGAANSTTRNSADACAAPEPAPSRSIKRSRPSPSATASTGRSRPSISRSFDRRMCEAANSASSSDGPRAI